VKKIEAEKSSDAVKSNIPKTWNSSQIGSDSAANKNSSSSADKSSIEPNNESLLTKSNMNNSGNDNVNKTRPVNRSAAPSRPGMLLIRPASNLVAAKTKTEYLGLTKYNDVRKGEFAPATRQFPVNNEELSDSEDGGFLGQGGDGKNFEFVGGNVALERSLLNKTKQSKKFKIQFDDSATTTFEYPSEQSLMDATPAQPGYCDYQSEDSKMSNGHNEEEDEDERGLTSSTLKSTPGLGSSTGSLATYKSRMQDSYQIGMYDSSTDESVQRPPINQPVKPEPTPTVPVVQPASDAAPSWSGTNSSDLLF